MSDKFVSVMKFHQSFEAQLAKNLLDNEGIESLLSGEQMSDLQLGNSAMGDQIVLQVREKDAQRAAGILAAVAAAKLDDNWEEQAESGNDVWLCSICGEPVSNRLSICYSCQTPREGIRTAASRDRTGIRPESSAEATREAVQKPMENTSSPSPALPSSTPQENQPDKRSFPFSLFDAFFSLFSSPRSERGNEN